MTQPTSGDTLLTADDLATLCRVSRNTVYDWIAQGKGPRIVRPGGPAAPIRYRRIDVEAWLDTCYTPTKATA